MLAKKHNSVHYNHIIREFRESAAAGILRVAKIPTGRNYGDALTQILPMHKRIDFCNIIDEKTSGEAKDDLCSCLWIVSVS